MYNYIWIVIALPLIGFLINGLFGSKIKNEKIIGTIGSGVIGISFLITIFVLLEFISFSPENRKKTIELFSWLSVGNLNIQVGYLVDPLSIVMTLIVTGVGFLIHVYSFGYMHGDKGFFRFFSYLNLFIFAMLNLVLADNYLLMFLGWEGVGLCSYLLIGFWYDKNFEKMTTSDAAKKAFIVNRIGDFGFLIAMFLIFLNFQSLNFGSVFSQAETWNMGNPTLTIITLLLFLGCTGKSAQIPLFVWLPDAMAGPTPVSALIHAATMVTAGVYLVARSSILFALAPFTLSVIVVIAILTAFIAASIGMVQNDIKKILAYSTISQLGYMFLALGVGSFVGAIFHLMTHAFFKACLFLGAGSVIHGMQDEQNIQKMGGLQTKMKTTYLTFLISALAISGIPPLSGFFSKDEILWKAFSQGSFLLWLLGAATALMTAFYMFRLVTLTFFGKPRWPEGVHPHESPKTMTIPLIVLAFFAIIGGFIGIPQSLFGSNVFEHWLDPVFEKASAKMAIAGSFAQSTEYILMAISIALGLLGIYLAFRAFTKYRFVMGAFKRTYKNVYSILFNKYFVDELYEAMVVKPVYKTSKFFLWRFFDLGIIDGLVNSSAKLMEVFGNQFRRLQTGVIESYAAIFVSGIIFILFWLILR
jgi:NADH-quinone oxidoreductase subunit L